MAWLQIRDRTGSEWRMLLDRHELNIGREPDNEVVLPDDQVSRHHARLVDTGQGWLLEDMGSVNGTRLGGHLITRQLVKPGEPILVGSTLLVVEDRPVGSDLSMSLPIQAPTLSSVQPPLPIASHAGPRPPLVSSGVPPPLPKTTAIPPHEGTLPPWEAATAPVPTSAMPGHSSPRTRRPGWGVVAGVGCFGLLAGGLAVTAVFLWPRRVLPTVSSPLPPANDGADVAAAAFGRALADADLEGALAYVEPSFRATLRQMFQTQPDRMQKLGAAVGARRLLQADGVRAEFEVSEDGRSFTIVFRNTAGAWMLSAL